jgi:hypothetical protein
MHYSNNINKQYFVKLITDFVKTGPNCTCRHTVSLKYQTSTKEIHKKVNKSTKKDQKQTKNHIGTQTYLSPGLGLYLKTENRLN